MKSALLARFVLGLALLSVSAALAAEPKPASFFVALSFDAAREQAAAEHKVVFIDFYTTWCGPCKMLDESTWTDARVVTLLSAKTVALKIDAEQERDLAKRYKITAFPTLLLLRPDGTEIDRIVGYRDPDKFIAEFEAGLAGKTALARAREAVQRANDDKSRVQARYNLGRELATAGQNEAALTEYLWCYDEGMVKSSSFTGVRVSFLLSSIAALGQSYPPAHAALVQRRDAALAQAQQPEAARSALADLVALNRTLHEEGESLKFYDALPTGDLRRAHLTWPLFEQLLAARRYADLAAGVPAAEADQRIERFTHLPSNGSAHTDKMNHDFGVNTLANFIEIYAGAGDLERAKALVARALIFDSSPEAKRLYRERLARAGRIELSPE